ncbi:hypothetical protein Mapa_014169 [Marchantia paleacea]|nr:hypothetical protein Mapa_014169 [Marchantia paleacea]
MFVPYITGRKTHYQNSFTFPCKSQHKKITPIQKLSSKTVTRSGQLISSPTAGFRGQNLLKEVHK